MTRQNGLQKLWADHQCCRLHLFKGICCTFVKIYQKDNVQLEQWLAFLFWEQGWEGLACFVAIFVLKRPEGSVSFISFGKFLDFLSSKILVWKYLGKHHNCVWPAETCRPAENQRFFCNFLLFFCKSPSVERWQLKFGSNTTENIFKRNEKTW